MTKSMIGVCVLLFLLGCTAQVSAQIDLTSERQLLLLGTRAPVAIHWPENGPPKAYLVQLKDTAKRAYEDSRLLHDGLSKLSLTHQPTGKPQSAVLQPSVRPNYTAVTMPDIVASLTNIISFHTRSKNPNEGFILLQTEEAQYLVALDAAATIRLVQVQGLSHLATGTPLSSPAHQLKANVMVALTNGMGKTELAYIRRVF